MRADVSRALMQVEKILPFLLHDACTGLDEPYLVYHTCMQVLLLAKDDRADTVLGAARAPAGRSRTHR